MPGVAHITIFLHSRIPLLGPPQFQALLLQVVDNLPWPFIRKFLHIYKLMLSIVSGYGLLGIKITTRLVSTVILVSEKRWHKIINAKSILVANSVK